MPVVIKKATNGVVHKTTTFSHKFPINKAHWHKFDAIQLEAFVEEVFQHYRLSGFPYYRYSPEDVASEFAKTKRYVTGSRVIMDKVIQQSMHGLSLCWSFFPHHNEVKCGDMMTPMEAFMNDEKLKFVIRKRLSFGAYVSDSGIRKTLKISSGLQGVSNFRPTAAAAIYRRYGGGSVYDMSSGFGGRLLGAMLTDSVSSYIGVDPSTKSHEGAKALYAALAPLTKPRHVELHKLGSEDFVPEAKSLDICFTSPPYFDTEKYSDEPTQSYKRFPNPQDWLDGFLYQTVENCRIGLKTGGFLILNLANVKSFPDFEGKFLKMMEEFTCFQLVDTLQYSLSSICSSGYKYEPVFVFNKTVD